MSAARVARERMAPHPASAAVRDPAECASAVRARRGPPRTTPSRHRELGTPLRTCSGRAIPVADMRIERQAGPRMHARGCATEPRAGTPAARAAAWTAMQRPWNELRGAARWNVDHQRQGTRVSNMTHSAAGLGASVHSTGTPWSEASTCRSRKRRSAASSDCLSRRSCARSFTTSGSVLSPPPMGLYV